MKVRSILLPCLVVLLLLAGCSQRFVKLADNEVKPEQRAHARELGDTLIRNLQASKFYPLGDEASAKMRSSFTPGEQAASWAEIHELYGDYHGMVYVEAWASRDGLRNTIYRFKGTFSSGQQPEVRVVVDHNGKLAGLWVKDWKDAMR